MNNRLLSRLCIVFFSLAITGCAVFQPEKQNSKVSASGDSKDKDDKIKPYSKVITSEAKSDQGLFTVHQLDNEYYFEIPDSLFNREMLMVTRIAETASGIGFGGGKQNTQVLRWQKNGDKVLLRVVSYDIYAAD
ncbi:MAG TPA: DUF5118 domain-containing protein, partial [Salinimicrobium sp.]|nr:DUF5118 domain-containing protein [Salinimicrobium sp.]